MPQSRTRKGADAKRKAAQARKTAERQQANEERRAAEAPTAAERRRAKRAERDAARAEESKSSGAKSSGSKSSGSKSSASKSSASKSSGSKSSGSKSSGSKSSGSRSAPKDPPRRRTTAERRGIASKGSGPQPQVRRGPASRRWVPPAFITAFALGVAWLIVYYVAGNLVPVMKDLGNWNILIGMGLMAVSFIIATLWK